MIGFNNKNGKIYSIFKVALPLIIQGLVFQLQSLTDKAFLGNLDTRFVSAVGAAQMPFGAVIDSLVAISIGIVIVVSKLYGAGKKEEMLPYVKSAGFYNSLLGILVFFIWQAGAEPILQFFQIDHAIIGYSIAYVKICSFYLIFLGIDSALTGMLQGMGETKPIMYAGILKVLLNILISWILIYGKFGMPKLLVTGAAIGTLVANLISFFFLGSYCLVIKKDTYRLNQEIRQCFMIRPYIRIIKLGIPVGLEYLLWNGSNLLLIRFINGFSYMDMAIYTLTFGFQCMIYVIFEGVSKAALTLMGQSIGAGKRGMANQYFYTSIGINFVIVFLAAVTFFLIPQTLLGIFSNDKQIIQNGVPYLEWIGIIMFTQSINVICGNAIRANDDTKWMLMSQILGSVLVVGVSWVLVTKLDMNMMAIYITLFLDETIRGGINFLYYRKKYSYKDTVSAAVV